MTYHFDRDADAGLILVNVEIDGRHTFKMVLDTGASHTTIDSTALYMADYKISAIARSAIETANGIVQADVVSIDCIAALGHTMRNVSIQVYDFLAHGILSDYDGILGLDFFENTTFTIDMQANTIAIIH
jgi:predicted aspartyl protease